MRALSLVYYPGTLCQNPGYESFVILFLVYVAQFDFKYSAKVSHDTFVTIL